MSSTRKSLTIGGVAKAVGVNVETVRFYQRKGLLREPLRPVRGIRRYDRSDVLRLRFIRSAQRLGFSLGEVTDLLRLEDGTRCAETSALAERKLAEVQTKRAGLERLEGTLAKLVRACRTRKGTLPCPLVASLQTSRELENETPGVSI